MRVAKPLVLASKSPRRIALLRQIGMHPRVIPSEVPEDFDPSLSVSENAMQLALKKADDVRTRAGDAIIIGADTIVALDGVLYSKPVDAHDARRMLAELSGRTHTVVTGFALLDTASGSSYTDYERTNVTFRDLPQREIEEYVAGGSPMDKAGAYGIQDDYGAVFVTRIEGCFYNVVGFPLARFFTAFNEFQQRLIESKGVTYVEKN
jgi:septum formation protein